MTPFPAFDEARDERALPSYPVSRSAGIVERLWYDHSTGARVARVTLAPLAATYGLLATARRMLYDHGVLRVHDTALPAVSVGNLSVGGTGKTPVAAWVGQTLRARGRRPGVVLRGYGSGDEILVHRALNPGIPVVAEPDRIAGIRVLAEAGCDVAVLDDAFQHRRARRVADIVLVSADSWPAVRWPLPAGPWRESLHALRRADVVVVTRKAVSAHAVAGVRAAIGRAAPDVPQAVAWLAPDGLRTVAGETQPLSALSGLRVLAVAGIASPGAFFRQLDAAGAEIRTCTFRDHHRYTPADVAAIVQRVPARAVVVCTLKDAVKLTPLWPREAPSLWYVSQRVELEDGAEAASTALDAVPRVRPSSVT